ncbi:protein FAM174C [Varanus komodoensis]|uniref:Family with sequence similarity 174 member C n=1 Tax=Varanus komodoensis TaxID=61221 RepID=A0A8D2LAA4_VARKO|nr:protein FAM174C [Varanus komodoensis]
MAALCNVVACLALWAMATAPPPPPLSTATTASSAGRKGQDKAQEHPAAAGGPSPTTAFAAPSGLGLPALHRALYVIAGVAGLGLVYYLGRHALRTRKPPRKKYGLLSNSDDHMEMGSLESDEDTVFETRNLRR